MHQCLWMCINILECKVKEDKILLNNDYFKIIAIFTFLRSIFKHPNWNVILFVWLCIYSRSVEAIVKESLKKFLNSKNKNFPLFFIERCRELQRVMFLILGCKKKPNRYQIHNLSWVHWSANIVQQQTDPKSKEKQARREKIGALAWIRQHSQTLHSRSLATVLDTLNGVLVREVNIWELQI